MRFKVNEETIWEDTGKIKVHNFPPSSRSTYSYITRVYKEIKKNNPGWEEVDGEPIYFHDMTVEQETLAVILGTAENTLSKICPREKFLIPIKKYKEIDREALKHKYFEKKELYWIRRRDGYKFDNEECGLAIDHYIETGQEP